MLIIGDHYIIQALILKQMLLRLHIIFHYTTACKIIKLFPKSPENTKEVVVLCLFIVLYLFHGKIWLSYSKHYLIDKNGSSGEKKILMFAIKRDIFTPP